MATSAKGKAKVSTDKLLEQERQRSTAKQWKSRSIGHDLLLPSGNVCLVKTIGPEAFLLSGVIPDTLAPIVQEAIRSGNGMPPEKVSEMTDDIQALADMVTMTDRVVVMCVLDPKVEPAPGCLFESSEGIPCDDNALAKVHTDKKTPGWHVFISPQRDEDVLYVDEVDFEDKNFILQYVIGGTKDLEKFREEQAESMASVSNG